MHESYAHPVHWQALHHLHALRPSLLSLLAQGRARRWPSTCEQPVIMYQERQAHSHMEPITCAWTSRGAEGIKLPGAPYDQHCALKPGLALCRLAAPCDAGRRLYAIEASTEQTHETSVRVKAGSLASGPCEPSCHLGSVWPPERRHCQVSSIFCASSAA